MTPFATEFPVEANSNRAAFVFQVITWLRGVRQSTVLAERGDQQIDGESASLTAESGETLRLRTLDRDGAFQAIGFQHDIPDADGRLWRTEGVLRRGGGEEGQDLVRLRTQCIARFAGARLETPRKPYFIKTLLQDGWGGRDGMLHVADEPHWLEADEEAMRTARAVTLGHGSRHLPVIYISASGPGRWLIPRPQIEKLAYDLGGVAHVVVEPDRAFSFRLRDETAGANVYGGTFAIALPGRGIVRRLYLGWRLPDPQDLLALVREMALEIRGQMPADGWDWTELQEQVLRLQRQRHRNRLTEKETEELYEETIANLEEQVAQLKAQLAATADVKAQAPGVEYGVLPASLLDRVGPEIYAGEFTDRLRRAAQECSARDDALDPRSRAVLAAIAAALPPSPALAELLQDLKRATKDPKGIAGQLKWLLARHGYREKSDNKHIRLEALPGYVGLEAITLPKTPSDGRGLINLRKQIEKILGISNLSN